MTSQENTTYSIRFSDIADKEIEKAIEDELMMFLENLEKKAEKIANEKSKISGQIEIDV